MGQRGQVSGGVFAAAAAMLLGAAAFLGGCKAEPEVPFSHILQADSTLGAIAVKPPDYTIVIVNEGGNYVILPDEQMKWNVYTGTTVQFINATEAPVRVTASPDVYQGADPFIIDSGGQTLCVVDLSHLSDDQMGKEIIHKFDWATWKPEEPPRMVTGGPKMIPTEPVGQ